MCIHAQYDRDITCYICIVPGLSTAAVVFALRAGSPAIDAFASREAVDKEEKTAAMHATIHDSAARPKKMK